MGELDDIRSFLFADEVKNTAANQDGEDSFYYFAVAVSKQYKAELHQAYIQLTQGLPKGFHAKDQYKPNSINQTLLEGMTDLLVRYRMPCICFRYDKSMLYELSNKHLTKIDDPEIAGRVNNWEFQAFFYFIQNLQHAFAHKLNHIEFPICAFFDRGIYGIKDKIEAVDFDSVYMKRAVFTSTNKIKLLGLADHLGFIFSKARRAFKEQNKSIVDIDFLKNDIFGQQLLKLVQHKLFFYLEAEQWLEALSINNIQNNP